LLHSGVLPFFRSKGTGYFSSDGEKRRIRGNCNEPRNSRHPA